MSCEIIFSNTADHVLFSLLGLALSVYALYVEVKKSNNPAYVAVCDFNDSMSCSRVLTSPYSKGFGLVELLVGKEHFLNIPNCFLGIIFYSMQLVLGFSSYGWAIGLLYYTAVISSIGSIYLAYVLLFILRDLCIVCVSTYVVNFSLLYLHHCR